jgi:hypothetical protein
VEQIGCILRVGCSLGSAAVGHVTKLVQSPKVRDGDVVQDEEDTDYEGNNRDAVCREALDTENGAEKGHF